MHCSPVFLQTLLYFFIYFHLLSPSPRQYFHGKKRAVLNLFTFNIFSLLVKLYLQNANLFKRVISCLLATNFTIFCVFFMRHACCTHTLTPISPVVKHPLSLTTHVDPVALSRAPVKSPLQSFPAILFF